MRVRIKKTNLTEVKKIDGYSDIKEIFVDEDILHPDKETVSICFRGKDSSGIVDFTPKEIEGIWNTVKGKINLIKGVKRFGGGQSSFN